MVKTLWVLISVLIIGIVGCIVIRFCDFIKTIKKQPKVKLIYSLREYEKAKFMINKENGNWHEEKVEKVICISMVLILN